MAKYTETQLSAMAVNPETKGRIVEAYPHLAKMLHEANLTHGADEDSLLRYLAYVYDPASPMVRAFPDIRERKKYAGEATKYRHTEAHTTMVVFFLQKVVRSLEWRVICAKEHAFGEYEERVYDVIKTGEDVKDTDIMAAATKKDILLKQMREIAIELPELKSHFYGEDKDLEKAAEKKDYSPEAMAGKVKK